MGFLDKIRRKKQKDANLVKSKNEEFVEKKESDNLNRVCIKFSIEFKNKYESINEYTKNEHENLLELLNTWRNKCPNDANSSLAYVILHSENDSLISINELESVYLKATDELQPLNPLLYEWFRNKAEISLKNKKYKIQIKSKINEGLIENESCHQILFKNFKYLDDLIHSGKKEISLDYDIRLDTDESYQYINIEENNIVIDGNGHSIDACERGRIFDCSGKNITIKNIIFQNSKGAISASNTITFINCCFHNNAGGRSSAITSSSSCLTFVNCDFNNNSAQLGGAIYLAPESFSYFENCNFYNNWAESVNKNVGWNSYDDQGNYGGHGGAIYCLGNIKLDNCLFDNNHADILGGAIFLKDYKASSELHECKFLRNYSYKMGGAIYNKMNSYLNNCYFENNQISYDYFFNNLSYGSFNANLSYENRLLGGAICSFREIIIENSKFKSNQADYGGAISNLYEMSLDDCLFENNEANNDGGAIINLTTKSFTKYLNIEMCNFINNIAKNQGGSLFNEDGSNKILCTNSTFKNNADLINKSIIYNENHLNILKSKFINIENCNQIIYQTNNKASFLSINDSIFESNSISDEVIFVDDGFSTIKHSKFIENDSSYLLYNNGITTSDKLKFTNNSSKIIYNNNVLKFTNKDFYDEIVDLIFSSEESYLQVKESISDIHGFLFLNEFIQNKTEIFLEYDILMNDNEQDFFEGGIELSKDNLIFDGQNHTIDANYLSRIFYITGKNVTLKNIIFKNGVFYKDPHSGNFDGGGAICVLHNASVSIENCKFINNLSMKSAGAINDYGGILKISESIFKNNKAEEYGGVLLNENKNLTIKKCTFDGNFAKKDGGTIYSNEFVLSKFRNGDFFKQINNLEISRDDYENFYCLYLEECDFTNNSTQHSGGAISTGFLNINCINCNFKDNFIGKFDKMILITDYSGGAISFGSGICELENCNFINNNSKNRGGAINIGGGKLVSKNCKFRNNFSRQGGAIYGCGILEKCAFEYNYVKHMDHGNVFLRDSKILVDTQFFDSEVNGGAIYGKCNPINCLFKNNAPNDML